jgi:hypothetical protein
MSVQDLILTVGSVIFLIALLPMLKAKEKPVLKTSVTTGVVLCIFSATYVSLELYFSAVTTLLTGFIWLALAFQRYSKTSRDKS